MTTAVEIVDLTLICEFDPIRSDPMAFWMGYGFCGERISLEKRRPVHRRYSANVKPINSDFDLFVKNPRQCETTSPEDENCGITRVVCILLRDDYSRHSHGKTTPGAAFRENVYSR